MCLSASFAASLCLSVSLPLLLFLSVADCVSLPHCLSVTDCVSLPLAVCVMAHFLLILCAAACYAIEQPLQIWKDVTILGARGIGSTSVQLQGDGAAIVIRAGNTALLNLTVKLQQMDTDAVSSGDVIECGAGTVSLTECVLGGGDRGLRVFGESFSLANSLALWLSLSFSLIFFVGLSFFLSVSLALSIFLLLLFLSLFSVGLLFFLSLSLDSSACMCVTLCNKGEGASAVCQQCEFSGCTVGVDAQAGSQLTLDSCNITDCYSDALIVRDPGTQAVVRESSLQMCGARGVMVSGGAELLLSGCQVDHNGGTLSQ